jgi:hypothetical protein
MHKVKYKEGENTKEKTISPEINRLKHPQSRKARSEMIAFLTLLIILA